MAKIQAGLELPRGINEDLTAEAFDDLELRRERQRIRIYDRRWQLVYRLDPSTLLCLVKAQTWPPWESAFIYYGMVGFRLRKSRFAEFLLEHETYDTLPGGLWDTGKADDFAIGGVRFRTGRCSSTFQLALGTFLRHDEWYEEVDTFWTLKVIGAPRTSLPGAVETALLFLGRRSEDWYRWPRLHTARLSSAELLSAPGSRRKQAKRVLANEPLAYYNRAMMLLDSTQFYDLAYLELLKALECIGGAQWENQLRTLRRDSGVSDETFVAQVLALSSRELKSLLARALRPLWRGHTISRVRKALSQLELSFSELLEGLCSIRNKVAHSGRREKEMEVPFALRDSSEMERWCTVAKLLAERAIDLLVLK